MYPSKYRECDIGKQSNVQDPSIVIFYHKKKWLLTFWMFCQVCLNFLLNFVTKVDVLSSITRVSKSYWGCYVLRMVDFRVTKFNENSWIAMTWYSKCYCITQFFLIVRQRCSDPEHRIVYQHPILYSICFARYNVGHVWGQFQASTLRSCSRVESRPITPVYFLPPLNPLPGFQKRDTNL